MTDAQDKPNGSHNPMRSIGLFLSALTGAQVGFGLFLLWAWGFGWDIREELGYACMISTTVTGLAAGFPVWWE